jgi:hypothetical protein
MSSAMVRDIMEQIERLSDEDQLVLSAQLAQRADNEWQKEAEAARRTARERGIAQPAIDKAIDAIRRGT